MEYDIEKISNKIETKRMTKKIFKYIMLIVFIVLFVVNLILSFEENTHIFGISVFNIVSESMEPILDKNDLVFVKKCDVSELKEGDIITFEQDGRIISHRIIDIINRNEIIKFETKGDNNDIADPDKVSEEQIYGKVLYRVKKIGQAVGYIQNARGFINVGIFAIIVYILVSLRDKQKNTRKIKRKKYEIKKIRDNYHL